MPKKKDSAPKVEATAVAKLDVAAKATYQVKKSITEAIPVDVTREKSKRWQDLFSPVTEWTGLLGDKLRFQRLSLRIQQDAALEELAHCVHAKLDGKRPASALPPKLLVPLLEGASLEDPASPLIDWWANLVVTGVQGQEIPLYFVDLMSKLGPLEAQYLEEMWNKFYEHFQGEMRFLVGHLLGRIESSAGIMVSHTGKKMTQRTYADALKRFEKEGKSIVQAAHQWGVPMQIRQPHHRATLVRYPSDFVDEKHRSMADICEALGLLEVKRAHFLDPISSSFEAKILTFSSLGISFMSACRPRPASVGGEA